MVSGCLLQPSACLPTQLQATEPSCAVYLIMLSAHRVQFVVQDNDVYESTSETLKPNGMTTTSTWRKQMSTLLAAAPPQALFALLNVCMHLLADMPQTALRSFPCVAVATFKSNFLGGVSAACHMLRTQPRLQILGQVHQPHERVTF